MKAARKGGFSAPPKPATGASVSTPMTAIVATTKASGADAGRHDDEALHRKGIKKMPGERRAHREAEDHHHPHGRRGGGAALRRDARRQHGEHRRAGGAGAHADQKKGEGGERQARGEVCRGKRSGERCADRRRAPAPPCRRRSRACGGRRRRRHSPRRGAEPASRNARRRAAPGTKAGNASSTTITRLMVEVIRTTTAPSAVWTSPSRIMPDQASGGAFIRCPLSSAWRRR